MKAYEILLIDEDYAFTQSVQNELLKIGVLASYASSKEEIIDNIRQKCETGKNYYLIVIDMHCEFITHEELREITFSFGTIMPCVLYSTSADKILQRTAGRETFKPKLILTRLLNALLMHPDISEHLHKNAV